MIIRPTIYTANPEAWKEFIHACGAKPIVEDETWSVYGLSRGRLRIQLATYEQPGSVSVGIETDRLDRFDSPYVTVAQPGDYPDLSVVGYDLPELLVHNLVHEPVRGGKLSASPLLLTTKVKDNIPVLESLGMELRTMNESETYADLAGDGILALHILDENESARVDLSFEHPDIDELAEELREEGFEPTIVDENYGRSLRVAVGGEQAWVNEAPARTAEMDQED